jgi:hypothetical protein
MASTIEDEIMALDNMMKKEIDSIIDKYTQMKNKIYMDKLEKKSIIDMFDPLNESSEETNKTPEPNLDELINGLKREPGTGGFNSKCPVPDKLRKFIGMIPDKETGKYELKTRPEVTKLLYAKFEELGLVGERVDRVGKKTNIMNIIKLDGSAQKALGIAKKDSEILKKDIQSFIAKFYRTHEADKTNLLLISDESNLENLVNISSESEDETDIINDTSKNIKHNSEEFIFEKICEYIIKKVGIPYNSKIARISSHIYYEIKKSNAYIEPNKIIMIATEYFDREWYRIKKHPNYKSLSPNILLSYIYNVLNRK